MKKILLFLSILLLPLSCLFISAKAYNISASQLDNVNLVNDIQPLEGTSAYRIYLNKENIPATNGYMLIQIFNVDDLNTPITYNGNFVTFVYRLSGSGSNTNFTAYTTNNNYGYRNGSSINVNNVNYIQVLPSSNHNINEFVFNVTFSYTSTGFLGKFIPNTFYNVNGFNDRGFFQYFSTYLFLQGQSMTSWENTSDTMIQYNNIMLDSYINYVYDTQNINTSYYYVLRVYFNNMTLRQLPNLKFSTLQCTGISVNNVLYDYSTAKSTFSWLYNNIVLYNDNATLFVSDTAKSGFENTTIQYMDFTLPDYAFKSSSYYQSSVGIKGYLERVSITTLSVSNQQSYENGVLDGYNNGYDSGYNDGYNKAITGKTTSFDNLMFSIADVPMKIVSSILNFNLLGFNLLGFFMGIITLVLFIHILKKFKE